MGIIQKQSIQSGFVIMIGFALGAFNMIIFAPRILTPAELGLTRIITDAGLTLATISTLGTLPIIYKFFPFYKSYIQKSKNDLPFITLLVCMGGFTIFCIAGLFLKAIIVRKFSGRSPLFVEFSYLVYPFAFFMLLFMWLESFSWSFKKGVISNTLKETISRILFTVLLGLVALKVINLNKFFIYFSFLYFIPVFILAFILKKTGEFYLFPKISNVTYRLHGKMINFGLFIFGAQFLNLLSRTIDTFILSAKSPGGLSDAAVFTIATYIVALMEIPQRSITSISVPVLAESWKNKDLKNISHIYTKSVNNLLIIGLFIFGLLCINAPNLTEFLGKGYSGIGTLVFLMGIGKLIDLGTGANSQIISTSSYWKVDFTTNVIYTILALPLNYILIAKYGLIGAAYSTLISLTFYNLMRFGFLWIKFNLQPYTTRDLLMVFIGGACMFLIYIIPHQALIIADAAIRTFLFTLLFGTSIYMAKISPEINEIINKFLKKNHHGNKRV